MIINQIIKLKIDNVKVKGYTDELNPIAFIEKFLDSDCWLTIYKKTRKLMRLGNKIYKMKINVNGKKYKFKGCITVAVLSETPERKINIMVREIKEI